MPSASALLRAVRELELVARRNVSSLLAGSYATSVVGRGLEFHEARRYVQGETVRFIDWKITARMREPWVRTWLEERQREVVVAVDVSPSMHLGWQRRTKLETAIEVAATLAVSAVEAGDRLGWVLFCDRTVDAERPRLGRRQLFRALRALVGVLDEPPGADAGSDPRAAIHTIEAIRGHRFVVFMISDFIDRDVPDDLRYLRHRHDVSLLHVYDPLEYAAAGPVRLSARSPEGRARPTCLRPGETGSLAGVSAVLAEAAGRHRIAFESIPTTAPVGPALARFLHAKRRGPRG